MDVVKRTENPRVGGSIPPLATIQINDFRLLFRPKTNTWSRIRIPVQRVRQRIGAVLTWAVAQGLRPDNPADAVKAVLPKHNGAGNAHRAPPYSEVAGAITAVLASGAAPALQFAFEFLVLTASRAGEVRFATWSEIALESATWTVPSGRMKAR